MHIAGYTGKPPEKGKFGNCSTRTRTWNLAVRREITFEGYFGVDKKPGSLG